MSHAVTTALAPMMKAAAVAISAPPKPPASTGKTSLALSSDAPDDLECSDLSSAQLAYLRALISGKTITAAAEEAGVARKTVYRWQSNPRFAAVLNGWRKQAMESARTQLVGLTDEAIETLAIALKKNRDVRVALALLKGVGGLSPKNYEQPDGAEQSAQ